MNKNKNNEPYKHCSICKHYIVLSNRAMWCIYLKKTITARKKVCKFFIPNS